MAFKFYITKNKFRWENNDIRLEFSNPSGQAHDEYAEITSINEIMYYYYDVKIYKHVVVSYLDDENMTEVYRWKLVAERHTYDFPCIEQLKGIIEYLLDKKDKKDCQVIRYRSGDVAYNYTLSTEGFACEDFYQISKTFGGKRKASYNVYVGCSFDTQGDLNSQGIYCSYVSESDIKELLKCINSFFEYTITSHNKHTYEYNKMTQDSLKIHDNRLYMYMHQYNILCPNYEEIESIFCINDNIDINYLVNNKTIDYDGVIIKEFIEETNSVKIINRNHDYVTIPLNTVVHINQNAPKEKLIYNVEQIKNDFYNIMSNSIKQDFLNLDLEDLFKKYSSAIVDRTWMCRTEHNLAPLVPDNGKHENVYEHVKNIIRKLKEQIKKENE